MQRVGFLIWKELIELRGDPRLFGVVILAPIIQLFLLGYAATTDVRNVPVVVADADRSAALTRLLNHYPHLSYAAQVELKPRDKPMAPGSLRPGVTAEQFSDYKSALSWFSAKRWPFTGN